MTKIIVAVSDLHIGSTIGLSQPRVVLDDGGEYRASKGQRWLWRNWLEFWDYVAAIASEHGAKVWTVFNGDLVEADGKNRTHQLITQNDTTILRMAADTLKPALDISERYFVMRGTAAHVNLSASMEEKIAIDIEAEKCKETDAYSWWQLCLECEGVLFDITHHGSMGRLPWSRSNALNSLAVRLILAYAGQRLPQVAIRSHNHRFAETGENYPVRVVALPAWQLATEYSYRLGIPELADIGGVIFVCKDKTYMMYTKVFKPERVKTWRET